MKYKIWEERSVYFIKLHGYVKIGIATNVQSRLRDLQIGNPYKLTIIRTIEDCTELQERWLHKFFSRFHIHGEWFFFMEEMLTIEIPEEIKEPIGCRDPSIVGGLPAPLGFYPWREELNASLHSEDPKILKKPDLEPTDPSKDLLELIAGINVFST